MFTAPITEAMLVDRYFQIRRTFKLSDNRADSSKRDSPSYDPAHKYTYVYDCLVHNMNFLTEEAAKDTCVDETTWGHGGKGEPGSGIVCRLRNKKVCRGGQTVLLYDADRGFPRAYVHRHKCHVEVRYHGIWLIRRYMFVFQPTLCEIATMFRLEIQSPGTQ